VNYQFHPDAEAEHLETVAYYETRQAGLGASYLAEFESALERVCEAPNRYPIERKL
jgi:toxin ParE1/3/4